MLRFLITVLLQSVPAKWASKRISQYLAKIRKEYGKLFFFDSPYTKHSTRRCYVQTIHKEGVGKVQSPNNWSRHIISWSCLDLPFYGSCQINIIGCTATKLPVWRHTITADHSASSTRWCSTNPDRQWQSSSFQYLDIISSCLTLILEGEYNGAS